MNIRTTHLFLCLVLSFFAVNATAQSTWQTATPITASGETKTVAMSSSNRNVYFKITVPEEGNVKFTVTTTDDLKLYNIVLYNLNGDATALVHRKTGTTAENYSLEVDDLKAGTYYIYLNQFTGSGNASITYTFTPCPTPNDPEPNDAWQEAAENEKAIIKSGVAAKGRLGYNYYNNLDKYDYYRIVVPEEGNAKFTITLENTLRLYAPTLHMLHTNGEALVHRKTGSTSEDGKSHTLEVDDLKAGTYYLQLNHFGGNGGYTINYTFTPCPTPNDPEPNDTWQEIAENEKAIIKSGVAAKGRLGYNYYNNLDRYDYYRIVVPEEGNAKFTITLENTLKLYAPTLHMLHTNGDALVHRKTGSTSEDGKSHTLEVDDLKAGTYYLQLNHFGGNGGYTIDYTFTACPIANDPEPNDTWQEIAENEKSIIKSGVAAKGRLGYNYYNNLDKYDYYRIVVPEEGNAKFTITLENTLRLYAPTLHMLHTNGEALVHRKTGSTSEDGKSHTLEVDDLKAGTYYLQLNHFGGNGGYTINYTFTPCPIANDPEPNDTWQTASLLEKEGEYEGRLGYQYYNDGDKYDYYAFEMTEAGAVEFTVTTSNGLNLYGLILYRPNGDNLTHIVTGSNAENVYTVKRAGLEPGKYYLLLNHFTGNGGYTLNYNTVPAPRVDFDVVQNLNTMTMLNKTQGGETYEWDFGDGNKSDKVNPVHTYTKPGYYEVTLKAKSFAGENTLMKGAHVRGIQRIESNRGGSGGKATISIHAGGLKAGAKATLKMGNNTIQSEAAQLASPGELRATFDLFNAPLGVWDIAVTNPGEQAMEAEKVFTIEQAILPDVWTDIQGNDRTLFGRFQTYQIMFGNKGNIDALGRIIWIVTPDDPVEIEFLNFNFDNPDAYPQGAYEKLKKDYPVYTITNLANENGTPMRVYGIMLHSIAANSEGSFKMRIKTDTDYELMVFQTESFMDDGQNDTRAGEYSSYESCVAWAMAELLANKALGLVLDMVPGVGCAIDVVNFTSDASTKLGEGSLTVASFAWSLATTTWTCVKDFVPALEAYKMTCYIVDCIVDIGNSFSADEECQKYKKKKEKKKKVRAVSSFDPNEMIGPTGFGQENAINAMSFPYTILFENKATATAPAQEVVITNQLDKNMFDLASFRFKNFGYGDKDWTAVQDGYSFVQHIDLRPDKNAILQVSGELDLETGIVKWQFITLDPETMDLTEDPDGGFLPPNLTMPQGEGFVSYVVDLKNSVKDGDLITNMAEIVFDVNAPILTNTYINRIDEKAPTSAVTNVAYTGQGEEVEITLAGNDGANGAGVQYYDIYMAEGEGEYRLIFNQLASDKARIAVTTGKTYRFYSIARDYLDHAEAMKQTEDYKFVATSIPGVPSDSNKALVVFPNPVKHSATVSYNLDEETEVEIYLVNSTGVKVAILLKEMGAAGLNLKTMDCSRIPAGFYMLVLETKNERRTTKIIVN